MPYLCSVGAERLLGHEVTVLGHAKVGALMEYSHIKGN